MFTRPAPRTPTPTPHIDEDVLSEALHSAVVSVGKLARHYIAVAMELPEGDAQTREIGWNLVSELALANCYERED